MSIKVRPYKRGGWEVDVQVRLVDGTTYRERRKAPCPSKAASKRWGEERANFLVRQGCKPERKEIPTLEEFKTRFISGYCVANRQKPSGIDSKETYLRLYVEPLMGKKPLDKIDDEDVQQLKAKMQHLSPKTANNALTVLAKMLRVAVEWKVIDKMPATVRLLKVTHTEMEFYEEHDLERLLEAAQKTDPLAHLAVLLGADAGLRMGEMIALEFSDIDFRRNLLTVARNDWRGQVGLPKGGRSRKVPMTLRLAATLSAARHLRGPRVLYRHDGRPLSVGTIRYYMAKAQKRAGLRVVDGRALGEIHILRHTFCSRLAMRGATTKSIQELAGHQHLSTTQRYMHLSPAARESAIKLLDAPTKEVGDGMETGASEAPQQ